MDRAVKVLTKKGILMCLLLSFCTTLEAASIDKLKSNIQNRKPYINQLLKEQKVGENNKGYLTIKKKLNDKEKGWVKSENRDRYKLYDLVAAEMDYFVSQKEIAMQRARNIRINAPRGIWIQQSNEKWILNR